MKKFFLLFTILITTSLSAQTSYKHFKKTTNTKSFKIFENKKLLKQANGKNTKIVIDISEQRIKLYVNNKVAIDSPATTGKKYKRTPKGTFKVTEKIKNKRSTIFGKIYKGKKLVYKGDRRKYKGRGKYVGAKLKNWMRLTNSGIGIHGSAYIHRTARSNGCIRVPYKIVSKIFKSVKKGTKVKIIA